MLGSSVESACSLLEDTSILNGASLIPYRSDFAAGCYTLVIASDEAKRRSAARVVFVDP